MEIDDLMVRFAEIPGAQVGRGPQHPRQPEPALAEEIEEFLRTYPALCRDAGYVDFLRRYAGAVIDNEQRYQIVDVLGFSDVSTTILEMDGPVVDSQGFLVFAQVIRHVVEGGKLRDTQEYDYAFDATGDRMPGIYWLYSASSQPQTLDPHTRSQGFTLSEEDFLGWLARIVGTEGVLSPPSGYRG